MKENNMEREGSLISIPTQVREITSCRSFSKRNVPGRHRLVCIERPRIFEGLSLSESAEIVSFAQNNHFLPTEIIFGQGALVRPVCLLVTGRVKSIRLNRSGVPVIVGTEGPGDIVCGLGLPTQPHDVLIVQASEACQVLTWEAQTFDDLCERFPILRHNSLQILNERLRTLEERFLELATEKVAPRLARTLIRLLDRNGSTPRQPARVGFSNCELAQMTAMTPFTVNRLLADWQQRGIIRKRRKAICVLDIRALTDLTGRELS